MKYALGLIETIGLISAIEAADAAVKAANVKLLGYENTKGGGKITVKFVGDVGAVQAGVAAGVAAAMRVGKVYGQRVIPRPHDEIEALITNLDRGQAKKQAEPKKEKVTKKAAPVAEVVSEEESVPVEEAVMEEETAVVAEPQQCLAHTKSGERCRHTALPGSDYCFVHRKLGEVGDETAV